MTVKILLTRALDAAGLSVEETVQTLPVEIFPANDPAEMLHLCQQHEFVLLIVDEAFLDSSEYSRIVAFSAAAPMLVIAPAERRIAFPGTGKQGEYIDYLCAPFTPALLLNKIGVLLHIHQLQHELCSCKDVLQEQRNKNHQWQQSLEQQNHYLNMLAIRDGLTGLFNRRHLNQLLEEEMLKARRENTDLALLLLDIDYFNETNRVAGQVFGDSILNEFAARLTQNAQDGAICFRFGGGDFMVLLPGRNQAEAREYAEKLRLACSEKPFICGHQRRSVTVSIGIVTLQGNSPKNQDEFINMADKAMYRAKAEGRNRVVAYDQIKACKDGRIDTISLLQSTLRRILEKTKQSSMAAIQTLARNVAGAEQDSHVVLASRYIDLLCQHLGLPKSFTETFSNGLWLYSCCRLLLYRELLLKKGKFTYDDRKQLNDLPYKLAELTGSFDYFANERMMLMYHGERYDGSGYPDGLAGDEIPLASRIFSLADAIAAMSSDRPHRKRLAPAKLLNELCQGAGTQWDPALVLLVLDILRDQKLLPVDEESLAQARLLVAQKISPGPDDAR